MKDELQAWIDRDKLRPAIEDLLRAIEEMERDKVELPYGNAMKISVAYRRLKRELEGE